jgi:hypothetical protein
VIAKNNIIIKNGAYVCGKLENCITGNFSISDLIFIEAHGLIYNKNFIDKEIIFLKKLYSK